LIVYGAVSDVMAMPNYVPPVRGAGPHEKPTQPAIYNNGDIHVVRAVALNKDDVVGGFESELLSVGKAIIHDKIVVIDPLSPDCTVILGSHNLGFKASYENDENLLIIRGNQALAQAYMTHVLDVYDHYRFRAKEREEKNKGLVPDGGMLAADDSWMAPHMTPGKGALAKYLARETQAGAAVTAAVAPTTMLGRLLGR